LECIACGGTAITERSDRTARGYRRFRCRECGGAISIIALVVFWRLRYKLSLRDLPEMFLLRGIEFSHEAVRVWEAKLSPASWRPDRPLLVYR
jgi:putative transposase